LKVAALQLSTLPMSKAKLDYYLMICKKRDISLVLLGEYNLNSFFKELENMSKMMIKEQSKHKIMILKELSKEYDITIQDLLQNQCIIKINNILSILIIGMKINFLIMK